MTYAYDIAPERREIRLRQQFGSLPLDAWQLIDIHGDVSIHWHRAATSTAQ